ncbi:MAG: recombination mediator RecR [Planctomycetota bacterium]
MARQYTESISNLREMLTQLPGVGEKTAERMAYHIVRLDHGEAMALADAIEKVKDNVKQCSTCALLSESDPCHVCSDPERDTSVVCVVEDSRDATAIEETGEYDGLYHVLCGRLAPLDGMEPEDLTVNRLRNRVAGGTLNEVILATNPDTEGDATALFVREALEDMPVTITRLARGVPSGSHLEYADAAILGDAIEERKEM